MALDCAAEVVGAVAVYLPAVCFSRYRKGLRWGWRVLPGCGRLFNGDQTGWHGEGERVLGVRERREGRGVLRARRHSMISWLFYKLLLERDWDNTLVEQVLRKTIF